jgi:hypothetical protein
MRISTTLGDELTRAIAVAESRRNFVRAAALDNLRRDWEIAVEVCARAGCRASTRHMLDTSRRAYAALAPAAGELALEWPTGTEMEG